MTLSGLSASELARIDSICLQFESDLREGRTPSIADLVQTYGGDHSHELEQELLSIEAEVHAPTPPRWDASSISPASNTKLDSAHDSNVFLNQGADGSGAIKLPKQGSKLGPYLISQQIAKGGMGIVFAAYDERLNRKVAIKTLTAAMAKRKELNERFEREARAVAAISHPHIVELFDVGSFGGLPYAVMEFLDGVILDEVLDQGPMDPLEIRRLGSQIADALATAHEAGVIHRDLKPQNIMLIRHGGKDDSQDGIGETTSNESIATDTMMVKVFDFGLSRMPVSSTLSDSSSSITPSKAGPEETREGVILGTPGYMSPEQAIGEPVTRSTDIFALGCVLHEAFYGKRAFTGETKSELIRAVVRDTPDGDAKRRLDDPDLAAIIDQCLKKDFEDRPDDAYAIARQLKTFTPAKKSFLAHHRRNFLAGALAAGALAAGVMFFPSRDPLHKIRSIGVLSFDDGENLNNQQDPTEPASPLGTKDISRGDQLAGLLVHELTRLPNLAVPKFRPVSAETPEQFRKLANELEVDALLTGTLTIHTPRTIAQSPQNMNLEPFTLPEQSTLDLQLISGETGKEVWGSRIELSTSDDLVEQTRLAADVANVIGQTLTPTADRFEKGSINSFACLIDGELRAEPDSPDGLEKAIMCFQMAHDDDQTFAEPLAGLALTSMTLAAQSPRTKANELIVNATNSIQSALKIDMLSPDARLAKAMLDWQMLERYDQADRDLSELVLRLPNRWQIRHQYGLLQLVLGNHEDAIRNLRQAQTLNPFSISVQADLARARWFAGDTTRAINDTKLLLKKHPKDLAARGLLIDIYEQEKQYPLAIRYHLSFDADSFDGSPESYYKERHQQLSSTPYSPFGDVANEMVWAARSGALNANTLGELMNPRTPMLLFLLATHPALESYKTIQRVQEILPL